ncbi:hypothetical protein PoB_000283800 [Plakobranchus ocellatus]|uniref:Uncharacterized protein n=1 Tax=Plakobranchus ocellatus TaxID=259542 RepID=A0AAV3Y1V3_9GAST|nr:hypothetical protein PoB_000283800 [Plakobranchus ocellatus]
MGKLISIDAVGASIVGKQLLDHNLHPSTLHCCLSSVWARRRISSKGIVRFQGNGHKTSRSLASQLVVGGHWVADKIYLPKFGIEPVNPRDASKRLTDDQLFIREN